LQKGVLMPCLALVFLTIAIGLGTESMAPYVKDAAETLLNPDFYIDAVLGKIQ